MDLELKNAVEILCKELAKDKSEGSYYYSWQAGIAMAFKDEVARLKMKSGYVTSKDLHEAANNAAKNFLDLLIRDIDNNNDVMYVAEKLYREANPTTKMDTPAFAYEQVEYANDRRHKANSDLNLYDWCKFELANKK